MGGRGVSHSELALPSQPESIDVKEVQRELSDLADQLYDDLDLELVAPDGTTVYTPWHLNPAEPWKPAVASPGYSMPVPEEARDRRNTVEQIIVPNATPGTWTVRVVASTLALVEDGATHIGVASDHTIESFRNELWPGYKTSEGMDPAILEQILRNAC